MKKDTKSRLSVGELPKRGCASVTELGAVRWSRSWFRSPRPTLSTRRVDSADGLPRCYLMQWVGFCPNPLLSSRILGLGGWPSALRKGIDRPSFSGRAFVLGDPEAMEYGDFDKVHHERKDNRPRKSCSHHKQRQGRHSEAAIRHRRGDQEIGYRRQYEPEAWARRP